MAVGKQKQWNLYFLVGKCDSGGREELGRVFKGLLNCVKVCFLEQEKLYISSNNLFFYLEGFLFFQLFKILFVFFI